MPIPIIWIQPAFELTILSGFGVTVELTNLLLQAREEIRIQRPRADSGRQSVQPLLDRLPECGNSWGGNYEICARARFRQQHVAGEQFGGPLVVDHEQ